MTGATDAESATTPSPTPAPLRFRVRAAHAPKEGNSEEEYEDAFACSAAEPLEGADRLTVALADGASSAVFARQWAQLLVTTFAADIPFPPDDAGAREAVARLGGVWREAVTGRARSWYAQEKLPAGSSAALLVADWDGERGTVCARAVGDVCLFLVRQDRLRFGFPLTKSGQFGDRPALLSTEPRADAPPILRFETPLEAGDRCLLMTDALAAYFLAEFEARRKPWDTLPLDGEAFAPWLKRQRDSGAIKNDDVTVVEVAAISPSGS
jgi:hypothetical protein